MIPNYRMFVFARSSRGLSQSNLAEEAGISQALLSKIESGIVSASPEVVSKLSRVLKYPVGLFYETLSHQTLPPAFFRRRMSLGKKAVDKITARMNLRRLHLDRMLESAEIPQCRVPRIDLDEIRGGVSRVAQELRAGWNIPPGPVESVIAILEKNGVVVIECDFETNQVDGLSIRSHVDEIPPIVMVSPTIPGDRLRFSICHELGHMILHHHMPIPPADCEAQADAFASEFLMPSREISSSLSKITLRRLAQLKQYWMVSMASLIMKAYDLGKITERQKTYFFTELSRRGWRTNEPVQIPRETPILIHDLVGIHLNNLGYTVDDFAKKLHLEIDEFIDMYAPKGGRRLKVVK